VWIIQGVEEVQMKGRRYDRESTPFINPHEVQKNTHTAYKEPNSGPGREECGAPLINAREVEYIHSHSTYKIN
jgi:hypothetical protein